MSVSTKLVGAVELNQKLDRYRYLVDGRGLRWITTEVSVQAKKILLEEGRRDTGGNNQLSGWRRSPRKAVRVRAGFELRSDGTAEFVPKPNGIWKVLEQGRDSGISKKRATRGRVYGRTAGKNTWSRAWAKINPDLPKWVDKANSELLRNSWK
jgi:hypothetical protein